MTRNDFLKIYSEIEGSNFKNWIYIHIHIKGRTWNKDDSNKDIKIHLKLRLYCKTLGKWYLDFNSIILYYRITLSIVAFL